jgi:oxygen-independent coproporphyrinogen-3 oxidase
MAGIYIHIPFCRKLCHYCDFYKVAALQYKDRFLDSLCREMDLRLDYLHSEPVESIYFGGGTPSVMNADDINRLIEKIKTLHRIAEGCEITLEANPDDLTGDFLFSLRHHTIINRLSIGIQSFHDPELKLMNRRHNALMAYECVKLAQKCGFNNISADLIYGLPGSSVEGLSQNMDRMLSLDIQHISAYHLTFEPGTLFHKKVEKGQMLPLSEDESLEQFRYIISRTRNQGFIHYEISNWAREGFFSLHNSGYWQGKSYLGLGPSAHSFNGTSRQWNISDVIKYINEIQDDRLPSEQEIIDCKTALNEHLLTSLRTMWGIDLDGFEIAYGRPMREKLMVSAEKYVRSGHLKITGKLMTLTEEGYFISDAVVSDLMIGDELE